MQFLKTTGCVLLMSVFVQYIYAQTMPQPVVTANNMLFNTTQFIKTDSGVIINRYYKAGCKNYWVNTELVDDSITIPLKFVPGIYKELPKQKFITVHGNVLYNFYYRSQIDTPFAESNVMQHLVQTNLNVLIKEKYPLRVIISNRSSNSAYFKNATDVNVQFNRSYLLENIKTTLKEKAISMVKTEVLGITEQEYNTKMAEAAQLKTWLSSPARAQELVEEKERQLRGNLANAVVAVPDMPSVKQISGIQKADNLPALNNMTTGLLQNKITNGAKEKVITTAKEHITNDSIAVKKIKDKKEVVVKQLSGIERVDALSSVNKTSASKFLQNKIENAAKEKIGTKAKEYVPNDSAIVKKYNTQKEAIAKKIPGIDKTDVLSFFNKGSAGKFLQNKIVKEAKEKAAIITKEHLPNDSSALKKYNSKKEELAKLEKDIKQTAVKLNQAKKGIQDSVNKIKKEISSLKTGPGLYAFMKKKGIASKELTTAQKILLSVNQFGLGRTWVDYSELTVKNISLGGINIEMNPLPYYVAFAAGKVNYRFRDFILKGNNTLPDQSLWLVRAGVGQKEKNNLIFTFYNGKKSVLNYTPSNNVASVQRVLGFSAEARFALNENNYIIAEIAKSSFQNAGSQASSSELVGKAFNWKIHNNEAYSIKLFSQYPQTDTKLTAFYKKTGENFQSFNLYPTNINQDAYMVRVNQYLFKRKVAIDAAIRKNDFVSPIAAPSFSSQTVFKSIQASVRIKKYPFVSVGYYPSSQLSLSNNNVLVENQYNTFNAISSYSYQVKNIGMNTNAVYTKFYNNSSDTGFIYFNASNYTVNQSFFLTPFVLQAGVSMISQKDLRLLTIEPLVSYQYKNSVTLSGSFKWNRLNGKEDFFGGTAGLNVYLKKLGTIQLNYDKTYVPGINNILKPVDIGRASFYREF
jgi:hypothetical protein